MEKKVNLKKILCINIVNNNKCIYKNKCMFAHSLDEQKKEPIRQYIYDIIFVYDDLSNINILKNKILFNELVILTKKCFNCVNNKCTGGYNCKFGSCIPNYTICYNDLLYGKCLNQIYEYEINNIIIKKCNCGIHLTEKNLIPHNQRLMNDVVSIEKNFLYKHNINYNNKNNIISLHLNDNTIKIVREIINNTNNKAKNIVKTKLNKIVVIEY